MRVALFQARTGLDPAANAAGLVPILCSSARTVLIGSLSPTMLLTPYGCAWRARSVRTTSKAETPESARRTR